mmetsp:Transcript_54722/g.97355  ORF Transcript_54722/g.97355 Transcript_54722/m.97355 type:complete len:293 (+) Transcript_54722:242-1120(+)
MALNDHVKNAGACMCTHRLQWAVALPRLAKGSRVLRGPLLWVLQCVAWATQRSTSGENSWGRASKRGAAVAHGVAWGRVTGRSIPYTPIHDVRPEEVLQARTQNLAIVMVLLARGLAEYQRQPRLRPDGGFGCVRVCVRKEACAAAIRHAVHVDVDGVHALAVIVLDEVGVQVPPKHVARGVPGHAPAWVQPRGHPDIPTQSHALGNVLRNALPVGVGEAWVHRDEPQVAAVGLGVVRKAVARCLRLLQQKGTLGGAEGVRNEEEIVHLILVPSQGGLLYRDGQTLKGRTPL